jgi:trigger factor
MNVIRQDVDALNAVLKVHISPADYQPKVKATLEKRRKTAKVPGFRPGNVPIALIQKQYGRAVLVDELNTLLGGALNDYIKTSGISILGDPLPKETSEPAGSFDAPEDFNFEFEVGLSPVFTLPLSSKSKYDYMKVKIDDSLVDKQIEDLRRRYGKLISVDSVGEKDMILAQFVELNDDESIKQGGILHSSTISMEFIEDAAAKSSLMNKAVGEKVVVNPHSVSRGENDTAAMLGIKAADLATVSTSFQLTINDVKRMELAELSQELFDKLFGEGEITNEKELRAKISNDMVGMFDADTDRLFTRTIIDDLMKNTPIDLPHAFLKRWIKSSNEKKITDEQIEMQYGSYADNLKMQLIQGTIFKENNIKIDYQEITEFTKSLVAANYTQYGMPIPEDKELMTSAMSVLKNQQEYSQIVDMMAEQKLTEFFKSTVKISEKEIAYEQFVALASA